MCNFMRQILHHILRIKLFINLCAIVWGSIGTSRTDSGGEGLLTGWEGVAMPLNSKQ